MYNETFSLLHRPTVSFTAGSVERYPGELFLLLYCHFMSLNGVSKNIGSLAGYPFAPYLTDGIGRKRTIIIGAFIMTAATILQTASQNVGMFIGARFLSMSTVPCLLNSSDAFISEVGFGLTFCANAAPLLVSEVAYPSQRAALTSSYNSLW